MRREVLAGVLVDAAMLDHGSRLDVVPIEAHPAHQWTFHHRSPVEDGAAEDQQLLFGYKSKSADQGSAPIL
jgi:hypothetical protein